MRNRWVYVAVGFIMNICLGTVYSWSVFRPMLHKQPYNLTPADSILPFSVFLLFFGLMFALSGAEVGKHGPRRSALIGAVLVGVGYLISSSVSYVQGSTMLVLLLGFGVVAGTGCAFAYNPPIATSGRWFPDKRGLALGLTVMGFGLSSLFTAPLVTSLLSTMGISMTFAILGACFLVVLILCGSVLGFPPSNWQVPSQGPQRSWASDRDLGLGEMLRTPAFYMSWVVYLIGAGAGLSIIGYAKLIALDVTHLSDGMATLMVSVLSVANAIGRPVLGRIADSIGPKKTLILTLLLQLLSLAILMPLSSNLIFLLLGLMLLGATFGAYLAVMPTLISYYYGAKNLGPNYGLCFSAYGIGGIVMPLVVSQVLGSGPSYTTADYTRSFLAMAVLVILALGLVLLMRSPVKRDASTKKVPSNH